MLGLSLPDGAEASFPLVPFHSATQPPQSRPPRRPRRGALVAGSESQPVPEHLRVRSAAGLSPAPRFQAALPGRLRGVSPFSTAPAGRREPRRLRLERPALRPPRPAAAGGAPEEPDLPPSPPRARPSGSCSCASCSFVAAAAAAARAPLLPRPGSPRVPRLPPPPAWESAGSAYLGDLLEGEGGVAVAGSPEQIRVGSRHVGRRELSRAGPGAGPRPLRSHAPRSSQDGAAGRPKGAGGFPGAVIQRGEARGAKAPAQAPAQAGCCAAPLGTLWGRIQGHPSAPHAPAAPPSLAPSTRGRRPGSSAHTAPERRGARVPGGAMRLGSRPTNIWNKQAPSRS